MNTSTIEELIFNEDGLIQVFVVQYNTNDLLMSAWMNQMALEKTISTNCGTYWSRSRNKLWMKGETSGNTQSITDILVNDDKDCILLVVNQTGPACHTGEYSCFFQNLHTSRATSQ